MKSKWTLFALLVAMVVILGLLAITNGAEKRDSNIPVRTINDVRLLATATHYTVFYTDSEGVVQSERWHRYGDVRAVVVVDCPSDRKMYAEIFSGRDHNKPGKIIHIHNLEELNLSESL